MAAVGGKEIVETQYLHLYQTITMAKIRAFIACDIPEPLLQKISDVQERLKKLEADVSWTRVSGIHLTLKFLGEITEGSVDKIAEVVLEAAKGQSAFEINIKGSGAFPNLIKPRVLWIGVEDRSNQLSNIRQELDKGFKSLGFETEEREFTPHLTIGRLKGYSGKERLSVAITRLKDIEIGHFDIDRLILYKSELRPDGAVYTKLREIKL